MGKEVMDRMVAIKFDDFDMKRIGTELEIVGVVYGNDKDNFLIALPGEGYVIPTVLLLPDSMQWSQIIRQSDLKEVVSKDKKTILRKSSRQIDQRIAWEVYRRDNFTCRYCGADDVPLTVDHVVTWETGGPTIPLNLITSCKKCNNKRGNMEYEEWLDHPYYISKSIKLHESIRYENDNVLNFIDVIRRKHLRPTKKSR